MPGRYASPDRSRFHRDLARLIVLVLVMVGIGVAAVMVGRFLIGGDDEPGSASLTPETSAPTSTVASTTTSTIGTTQPPDTLAPAREPDRVIVLVLNSTQVPGLAGRLTERLSGLGYRTLDPDNHPVPLESSVIWYVEGYEREARVLAGEIPDTDVEPFPGDEPGAALTVVLGASYRE